MTDQQTPLTQQQLDEIEAKAAELRGRLDRKNPWPSDNESHWTAEGWKAGTRNALDKLHVEALAAEVRRLRAGLEAAQRLAADATAYQVHVPEGGGTTLLVRRQASAHGTGWAVSIMAPGGGRAWTTEGWQESISALSVDRLFCWPAPVVAAAEARRALAAAAEEIAR